MVCDQLTKAMAKEVCIFLGDTSELTQCPS